MKYVIFNHNTNQLEFFESLIDLLTYLDVKPISHNFNEKSLLDNGYFLLRISVHSFGKTDSKSNLKDFDLAINTKEYIVPLPLFISSNNFYESKNILSIWNCILQKYSELLNKYSEEVLDIVPFDINFFIHHKIILHNPDHEHDEIISNLGNILTKYTQTYLTNEQ